MSARPIPHVVRRDGLSSSFDGDAEPGGFDSSRISARRRDAPRQAPSFDQSVDGRDDNEGEQG